STVISAGTHRRFCFPIHADESVGLWSGELLPLRPGSRDEISLPFRFSHGQIGSFLPFLCASASLREILFPHAPPRLFLTLSRPAALFLHFFPPRHYIRANSPFRSRALSRHSVKTDIRTF